MNSIHIVLIKELKDCFRDKRSIVMMLLPILIFPMLFSFYNYQVNKAEKELTNEILIASSNKDNLSEVYGFLTSAGVKVTITASEDNKELLKLGDVFVILEKDATGYHATYNPNSVKSTKAISLLSSAVEACKNQKISVLLEENGESQEIINDYTFELIDVSQQEDAGTGSLISIFGPMLIVMFIATAGTSIAIDLFCGEKERGSLESLLATQASRKDIYISKIITVFIFVCFGTIVSVGGYIIAMALSNTVLINISNSFSISLIQIGLMLLIVCVFAFFTTTIICALSIGAKSAKEANLRISLFTLLPTIIGGVSMYMESSEHPVVISVIPVINTINVLKIVLNDIYQAHINDIGITILSTVCYGLIFFVLGYKIMNSEKVLDK